MFRKSSRLMIILSLVLVLAACGTQESSGSESGNAEFELGDPIATVNGVTIHNGPYERAIQRMVISYEQQGLSFEGEYGEMIMEQISQQTLNQMIQIEVLVQEAEKHGLLPSDSDLLAEMDSFRNQYDSDEDYQKALSDNLFTEDEFRSILREDLSIEALFDAMLPETVVTEEEVLQHYEDMVESIQLQIDEMRAEGKEFTTEELARMSPPFFEEIREELKAQLIQQKSQENQMEYLDALMEDSEIEVLI